MYLRITVQSNAQYAFRNKVHVVQCLKYCSSPGFQTTTKDVPLMVQSHKEKHNFCSFIPKSTHYTVYKVHLGYSELSKGAQWCRQEGLPFGLSLNLRPTGTFPCRMTFFPWQNRFYLGASVSSNSPKTCRIKSAGYSRLPSVSVNGCSGLRQTGIMSRVYHHLLSA